MMKIAARRIFSLAATLTVLVFVTACGHTTSDRALSGAGIGAGVGAVGGALTGNAAAGAAIGAIGGAAVGAATDERTINFGRPAWRR